MRRVVDGLGAFTGRGACTDAERRAALWLHAELRARGREAWVQTRWVRPQRAAALALACLAAVAGGLLSTVAAEAGLAVAALGPRRAGRRRRRPQTAAAPLPAAGDAAWLGAAQLLPTLVVLAALAAAIDAALSEHSPGANDNASGVAVAIALFEALGERAALLLVGAGHAVPGAVDDHLRRERLRAEVLEIGACGGGRPQRQGRRIACVDERGIAPRAHKPDDLPQHVDDGAMEAALAFALEDAERREVLDRL